MAFGGLALDGFWTSAWSLEAEIPEICDGNDSFSLVVADETSPTTAHLSQILTHIGANL